MSGGGVAPAAALRAVGPTEAERMTDTVKTIFTPSGRRGEFPVGTAVLDAARSLGVDIDSVCGGRGICGRCQISVGSSPAVPEAPEHLSGWTDTEAGYRGRRSIVAGGRLSCMAELVGDIVIDVPPESQVHRQVVRKRAEVVDIAVDPVVRLHYVELTPATMEGRSSDLHRILDALEQQWELRNVSVSAARLGPMQAVVQSSDDAVTVAVRNGFEMIAVFAGFHDAALGVAFDVGSTTIAGHLCDLSTGAVLASAGRMNPQIRFGEDLMSRVSYVMMNPGGEVELTAAVRAAMDEIVGELIDSAGVARNDVLEVVFVGNPIMHHLVLGIDPTPLGTAPFALATDESVSGEVGELGIQANSGAHFYALPCVAGHVGADTTGAILSESPHTKDPVQLLVDVGTNAEIVLGNKDRLLAASSPTGPAFEGAQISSGQRAAPGAIERVRIDRETLTPRYRIIGVEHWSDEDGFAEAAEKTGITGICGSGIIEVIGELFLCGVIDSNGVIRDPTNSDRVVVDERTMAYRLVDGDSPIMITQNDVRAIQLAKAALYAGVRLLMDRLGVVRVDEIRLAGAFGSHIDTVYATVIGLIPDCDQARVSAAGNAAGTGAIMALLSAEARQEIEDVARRIEKIETAVEPAFQELFVGAMAFPHASDAFPELAKVVDLPEPTPAGERRGRRRRRNQRVTTEGTP